MSKQSTQGFTVLELLIVVAILGILAAVLIPNLLGARRTASNTAAQSLLRHAILKAEVVRDTTVFSPGEDLAGNARNCNVSGIDITQWGTTSHVTRCRVSQDAFASYAYTRSKTGNWYYYDGTTVRNMGTAWSIPW